MNAHDEVQRWIEHLGLGLLHPEGGYYLESFRSTEEMEAHGGSRNVSTAIYFLVAPGQFSAFHRQQSDELWHHYAGGPLEIFYLQDGELHRQVLGGSPEGDMRPQVLVPGKTWMAARPLHAEDYNLAGCTVAPGFDFEDWELADAESLANAHPEHRDLIVSLCATA